MSTELMNVRNARGSDRDGPAAKSKRSQAEGKNLNGHTRRRPAPACARARAPYRIKAASTAYRYSTEKLIEPNCTASRSLRRPAARGPGGRDALSAYKLVAAVSIFARAFPWEPLHIVAALSAGGRLRRPFRFPPFKKVIFILHHLNENNLQVFI
ncbi:hypothetical protein EVAR_59033_1 [Eumeta japonica]|uniref:Uncharacterized protein n=1 Tax=Eumeta variegata TaxID=151549 RepID=A0A4C1Z9K4_EUMVA|nr:hypothetical protein EVAR_59033_1 [Eumeta japonica]